MRKLVLDMDDRRPVYAMPDHVPDRIRAALPDDWTVEVVDVLADGSGDGSGAASPETLAAVADAEVYLGLGIPASILEAGPALKWVHTGTAGVGSWLTRPMLERDILFTNSAGIFGPPIAESVLAFMLYFARGLPVALEAQRRGVWEKRRFDGPDAPIRELAGSTVGVLGLGGIGREVARRCVALGARVLGLRRRRQGVEDVPGVEVFHDDEGFRRLLRESDFVVVTVPETRETRGLVGREALALMRRHAVLINVGRGPVVDEDALVAALNDGRIGGAALDVFRQEPLPEGHPLWSAPDLIITPHMSAYGDRYWGRQLALILDNIERYLAGRALVNVVDKEAGY